MAEKSMIKQGAQLVWLSLLVACLSFVKEAIFARYFGISVEADAYTVAIQIPEVLFAVVWEAIHTIVIPIYTEKKKESSTSAKRFISCFWSIILIFTVFFICFGELVADVIVTVFAPGLSFESKTIAVSILRWIFPVLLFEGTERICNAVLNVNGDFSTPKYVSAIRNVSLVWFITIFAKRFGVFAAAYGLLVGVFVESVVSYLKTLKCERLTLSFHFRNSGIIKAGKLMAPVIVGTGVSEINKVVDKMVASYLSSGSIAALNYASKLTNIIETVCLNNIITLVYPAYSKLATNNDKDQLCDLFLETLSVCMILCLPIICGGVVLRREFVTIAFKRGEFSEYAVGVVGLLFGCYLLNSLFAVIRGACVRLFMATYQTGIVSVNSVICMIINLILNVTLVRLIGVSGLALATVISTFFSCVYLIFNVKRILPLIRYENVLSTSFKAGLASGIMSIILVVLQRMIGGVDVIYKSIILVVVGVAVYGGMISTLGIPEVVKMRAFVKTKIKKRKNQNIA